MSWSFSNPLGLSTSIAKSQRPEAKSPGFAEVLRARPVKYSLIGPTSKSVKQFVRSIK